MMHWSRWCSSQVGGGRAEQDSAQGLREGAQGPCGCRQDGQGRSRVKGSVLRTGWSPRCQQAGDPPGGHSCGAGTPSSRRRFLSCGRSAPGLGRADTPVTPEAQCRTGVTRPVPGPSHHGRARPEAAGPSRGLHRPPSHRPPPLCPGPCSFFCLAGPHHPSQPGVGPPLPSPRPSSEAPTDFAQQPPGVVPSSRLSDPRSSGRR